MWTFREIEKQNYFNNEFIIKDSCVLAELFNFH